MKDLYELAEAYADEIIQSQEFQKLLALKKEIKLKLSAKIIAFKTAEAKYLEAKSYGTFHPNLKEYQEQFVLAKSRLYAEPLVKEYKALERSIQNRLNSEVNELKNSISNKFKLTQF